MLIVVVAIIILLIAVYYEMYFSTELIRILEEKDYHILAKHLDFNLQESMVDRVDKLNRSSVLLLIYPISNFNLMILITICLFLTLQFKYPYLKAKSELKKQIEQIKLDFPIWLRQLQVLMQAHTVVNALEQSTDKAPLILKADITLLVERLHNDPLSVDNYINFLDYLPLVDIKRAMKMLYRYSIIGQSDAYGQFNRFIIFSTKLLRKKWQDEYETKLFIYQWWAIVPLFAVTGLFMVLMMSYLTEILAKGGI